jgi:hypothetical protein
MIRKILNFSIVIFALIGFVFTGAYVALRFGWTNVKGSTTERNNYFLSAIAYKSWEPLPVTTSSAPWATSEEWGLLKEVFTRDQATILRASKDSGVPARLILSAVIGEQFRFLTSRREAFKSYFEPLKILPSLSNISYGIAGIKPKTAMQIEDNLKNSRSAFYLGSDVEHVLDYTADADVEGERMTRITNSTNAYYSYLYVGLYLHEIQAQWQHSGYNITDRPDVLATLYNLGFYYSTPNAYPKSGGTVITINGTDYAYGDLASDFYNSDELLDIFPRGVQ